MLAHDDLQQCGHLQGIAVQQVRQRHWHVRQQRVVKGGRRYGNDGRRLCTASGGVAAQLTQEGVLMCADKQFVGLQTHSRQQGSPHVTSCG